MSIDAAVAAIACRQNALITYDQAIELGLSKRQILLRTSSGRWEPRRRGVYAISGAPPTERQVVLAACLAAGGAAAASELTAGRLWGLRLPQPAAIDLVGPRRRLDGVRSHQSTTLVPEDLTRLGALPLTSVARTLVDCAGAVAPEHLGAVVDDALRRGLVRLDQLRAVHERVDTGPGRRPTVAMRDVLEERRASYSPGDSAPEAEIVAVLTARGLPAPVLGHRVRVGRSRYKLDISWPESMVGIEFDSWDFHRTFTSFHKDRERHRRLVAAGWTILLVTAQTDLDELVTDLHRLLSWRAATA